MFRFIDFFNTDEAIFQEKVGTRTYWVFEGNGRFPYTTLISSKVGNKDGGYYGWETKERAIEYIKKQVEEAKQSILRSIERKKTQKEQGTKMFEEIKIGDIYVTSWGYEAQWWEFYKVVDKKNGYVYLQKLEKEVSYEGTSYGYCSEGIVKPTENPVGEVFRRKVGAYGFKGYESFEYCARKYNPEKTYEEGNWH
jgi:hypothetical protein